MSALIADPWFQFINAVVGVSGLIFAVYAYFRTRSVKNLIYDYKSKPLFQSRQFSFLNAVYFLSDRKNHYENVNILYVIVWNRGSSVIKNSDIAEPFSVKLPLKTIIVDLGVETCDDLSSKPTITRGENGLVSLQFDFLRQREAVIYAIVYEGTGDEPPTFSGAARDFKSIKRRKQAFGFGGVYLMYLLTWLFLFLSVAFGSVLTEPKSWERALLLSSPVLAVMLMYFGPRTWWLKYLSFIYGNSVVRFFFVHRTDLTLPNAWFRSRRFDGMAH